MIKKTADKKVEILMWDSRDTATNPTKPVKIEIWADDGLEGIMEKVEGVCRVIKMYPTLYDLRVDPRYDLAGVKYELRKAILEATHKEPKGA